jgi:hypothetical protein
LAAAVTATNVEAAPLYSITSLGQANDPNLARFAANTDPTFLDPLVISGGGQVKNNASGTGDPWATWSATAGSFTASNIVPPNNPNSTTYLDSSGQQLRIMPPGAQYSEATGVNSSGNVVGFSDDPKNLNFVYSFPSQSFVALNLRNLATSPATSKYYGINDQNQIIGSYNFGTLPKWGGITHAFLGSLSPGTPGWGGVDLNTLIPQDSGWILTSATGINNAGQIVGYGIGPGGVYGGYELTPLELPVPEPSVLAFIGLVGIGLAVRHALSRA